MAEPKPFRPSPRQRRLAEAACSLTFNIHPHLVCAQAQIPPSTYYRWQKNPAFTAWLAATILQCLAANSPFLLLNTLQAAMSGDASARKLIFQFCIAPRLAPAMAALPAPGLEVFLGIPAVPGSEGPPPARPPSLVPRPSSPTSAGGMAVPASAVGATTPAPERNPPASANAAPNLGARAAGPQTAEPAAAQTIPLAPTAPEASPEPNQRGAPAAAEPSTGPIDTEPSQTAQCLARPPSPIPRPGRAEARPHPAHFRPASLPRGA